MNNHPFTRKYFQGTGYVGLYLNFPLHYKMAEDVLKREPQSVLEVGGARGYICKIIESKGVKAVCMDISEHCYHTRATDSFVLHDAVVVPWKFKDKEFDLCFTKDFMEHLPEDKVSTVIKEMVRVSRRGYHKITFAPLAPNDTDPTHRTGTIKPREWWLGKFKEDAPNYPVEVDEKDPGTYQMDLSKHAPSDGLVKLNVGCFLDMFHYGWENIDEQNLSEWARQSGYVFSWVDVKKGMPKPDSSVDVVLASHFIEHLSREEGTKFVSEVSRVLKPNGLLRLAIPDTKLLCKKYLKDEIMEYRHVNLGVESASDTAEALFHLLLAGHKTIYDYGSLKKLLEKAGFKNVKEMAPFQSQLEAIMKQTIPAYPTLSAYVECVKPQARQAPKAKPEFPSSSRSSGSKLKIALISTPYFTTPPPMYGGLEMIVADLGEDLAQKGHDVTVFAANGSKVEGCKIVEFGAPLMNVNADWHQAERKAYEVYKEHLKDYDVIHGHDWFGFEYLAKAKNPQLKVLHTHHGGFNLGYWKRSVPPFKLNLVAISDHMVKAYASQGFTAKRVYNGINLGRYPLKKRQGNSLLFLGRISKIKAPDVAIEVAKKANRELDVVGGTSFIEDVNYVQQIRSMCDGKQIRFIGEVSHESKLKYLQDAKALLVPSRWGEPFGLHVIEALAVGTPVLAFPDGGVAETVKEGGIFCDGIDTMADSVKQVSRISPKDCRKNAALFSREKMAENYLKFYRDIISGVEW